MTVLALAAWPVAALIAALVLGRVLRNLNQPTGLPAIPDWACPTQCPPAMTIDSDGQLLEVWT